MTLHPAAVVCVLLAILAAPCTEVGGLPALAGGGTGCGAGSCCCADASEASGSCCNRQDARRPPQLVSGCRCGTHGSESFGAAPPQPRACSDRTTPLPDLRPACAVRTAHAASHGEHPAPPEPPPPRLRD